MKRRQRARFGSMKRSVTRRGGVGTSVGGEAAPGMGKGGNDASWAGTNLKKIHALNSVATNGWLIFKVMMS
jgi:hypothetical protein